MARTGYKTNGKDGESTFSVVPLSIPVAGKSGFIIREAKYNWRNHKFNVTAISPNYCHVFLNLEYDLWYDMVEYRYGNVPVPDKVAWTGREVKCSLHSVYHPTHVLWTEAIRLPIEKFFLDAHFHEILEISNKASSTIFDNNPTKEEYQELQSVGKMFCETVLKSRAKKKMAHKWISQTRILIAKSELNIRPWLLENLRTTVEPYSDDLFSVTFPFPIHLAMVCDYDTFIQMTPDEKSKIGLE